MWVVPMATRRKCLETNKGLTKSPWRCFWAKVRTPLAASGCCSLLLMEMSDSSVLVVGPRWNSSSYMRKRKHLLQHIQSVWHHRTHTCIHNKTSVYVHEHTMVCTLSETNLVVECLGISSAVHCTLSQQLTAQWKTTLSQECGHYNLSIKVNQGRIKSPKAARGHVSNV